VFTPFTQALPIIQDALFKKTERQTYIVKGGTGQRFRESVDSFKVDAKKGNPSVLLVSIHMAKSWSVSKAAYECYFMGYDWNATTNTQAEDRLSRDGQTETTFARYFVHEGTHDTEALAVVAGKRRLADVILDRARRKQ
jgi:SNF2 family DNA or RNA helicase